MRILDHYISIEVDDHIWDRHKIDSIRLPEIVAGHYKTFRNRSGRSATHLLIGKDFGGRCYVVPIRPTADPVIWEALSAWPCDLKDLARLQSS